MLLCLVSATFLPVCQSVQYIGLEGDRSCRAAWCNRAVGRSRAVNKPHIGA